MGRREGRLIDTFRWIGKRDGRKVTKRAHPGIMQIGKKKKSS
jgi:hypothetical protein